jgi:hypothetical protein
MLHSSVSAFLRNAIVVELILRCLRVVRVTTTSQTLLRARTATS